MKSFFSLRLIGLFLFLFLLPHLSIPLKADESLRVSVRKGDTISYLSFKVYGMYDPKIAEILKKENPQVKDINWIYVGQELRFPAPEAMRKRLAEKPVIAARPEPEVKEARIPSEPSLVPTQVRASKGVITFLEGTAQVKKSGQSEWSPAHPNMILSEKDQIKVLSQSRAELILDNQTVMRLSENSILTINKLEENRAAQKETARMDLSLGKLWVRLTKLFDPASRYDVKTPTVIAGVLGTTYQIMVAGDQKTTIQVFEGTVHIYNPFPKGEPSKPGIPTPLEKPTEVAGPTEVPGPAAVSREEWTQIVLHQFQQITVRGREIPQPTSFDVGKERRSEWIRWNEARDADFQPPARPR